MLVSNMEEHAALKTDSDKKLISNISKEECVKCANTFAHSQVPCSRLPCYVFYICLLYLSTNEYQNYKSVELGDQLGTLKRHSKIRTGVKLFNSGIARITQTPS